MKIESKLKRKGGTPVSLPMANGRVTTYLFEPEKGDPEGPHVCEVVDPDHIGTLLGIKEGYRLAAGNTGTIPEGETEDLMEIEAGESLTFMVIKSGHAVMSVLATMGLELVDQRLGLPPGLVEGDEDEDAAPPVKRSLPADALDPDGKPATGGTPTEPPKAPEPPPAPVVPPKPAKAWHDGMSDADLIAKVKEVTGRAAKSGTKREAMITAIEAAAG